MTTETTTEGFDCIRFVREARARIHEETKHMSAEEFVQWLHSRRPTNPKLAALKDRKVSPKGRRVPTPPSDIRSPRSIGDEE